MKFIPLASPAINAEDIKAVTDVLSTGMLVQGIHVAALENNIGSFIQAKEVAALTNGTATLHLALVALGIGKGDEVIVPAFSYIATANVVELVGAKPIFVDIDLNTFNIDTTKIEAAITANTKAIIPVHEFGLACDIAAVMVIANKHNLFVIEDAACALGAKQNNKFVGTFGTFGSFSLHPRKAISCGEGGLLTTNDILLANKIKILRNHGIEMIDDKMEFVLPGFNYRLTDFQAALVVSQLKRLPKILTYKQELATIYMDKITNPNIQLPVVPHDRNHTWQTFHVLLNNKLDRDKAIETLKLKNIGSNYGAQCMPAQRYFQKKYQLNCEALYPNAMNAYTNGLAIPIYEKLTKEDINYIAEQLNKL
ncbi:MAG: DegT/DnrJ/EryC1/StrS aminotransferase family protein [Bacteroidia bacterium]